MKNETLQGLPPEARKVFRTNLVTKFSAVSP